jgi:hypothetical protein
MGFASPLPTLGGSLCYDGTPGKLRRTLVDPAFAARSQQQSRQQCRRLAVFFRIIGERQPT